MAIISSKLFLLMISLVLALFISSMATNGSSSFSSLQARLKLDGDVQSLNCWDSLIQLQSCTGEIILFFLNGETYLGHSCCQAFHTIGKHCWPSIVYTLGFTPEESDILEGYCDHETNHSTPRPPSPPSVGFAEASPMKTLTHEED